MLSSGSWRRLMLPTLLLAFCPCPAAATPVIADSNQLVGEWQTYDYPSQTLRIYDDWRAVLLLHGRPTDPVIASFGRCWSIGRGIWRLRLSGPDGKPQEFALTFVDQFRIMLQNGNGKTRLFQKMVVPFTRYDRNGDELIDFFESQGTPLARYFAAYPKAITQGLDRVRFAKLLRRYPQLGRIRRYQ